jgi:hypothetical protein
LRVEKSEVRIREGITVIDPRRTRVSGLESLDKIQRRKGLKFENSRVWSFEVINTIDFMGQVSADRQLWRIGVWKRAGFEISKPRSQNCEEITSVDLEGTDLARGFGRHVDLNRQFRQYRQDHEIDDPIALRRQELHGV